MPALPENPPAPVHVPAGGGDALSVGPGRILRKLTGAQTGGRFSMVEYAVGPRFAAPAALHWHTKDGWTAYVLEGRIAFRFADRTLEAGAGDVVTVPSNCPFAWSNPTDEPARILYIYFPAGFDEYFFEAAGVIANHPGVPLKDLSEQLVPLWSKYGIEAED